jgi:hypothetical protein
MSCSHEAAHAVAVISIGGRLDNVEVGLYYQWYYGGKILVRPRGLVKPRGAEEQDMGDTLVRPSSVQLDHPPMPFCCWRSYLRDMTVTAAGPVGEEKFRARCGLPPESVCVSDRWAIEHDKRLVWLMTGRDGDALGRLAWRSTRHLLDDPIVWCAVEAVGRGLFKGLLQIEPADHQPGDSVKFVMPGERAEALMVGAGIILPNFISRHQCGPNCIKPSRKTSRRWQQYVAEWAAEEPKNAA